MSLCDDPTDRNRDLGMYDSASDTFVPMMINGSFCSLLMRCHTDDELTTCRRIVLSSEEYWDPHGNPFGFLTDTDTVNTDFYNVSSFSRGVDARHVCAKSSMDLLPTNLVPHGASDFDIAMCSILPALCHSTLIQCTVASSIIKPTDAAITLDRHHPVNAPSLAKNLGLAFLPPSRP